MFPARTTPAALAAVLALLLVAVVATPAHASAGSVIRDCSEDGILNGKYSQSELGGALEQLPSDLDEYTDCRAVIRRAQLGAAGDKHRAPRKTSTADRVDAAAPPTGTEQQELDKAAGSGSSVRIGGEGVRPGGSAAPFNSAGFGTDLPPFILIVLLALAGLCIGGLVMAARRRGLGEGVKRGISRFRR